MIKLQNLTPRVYSDQSRDFQLFERLFDVALNSVKTNSDNIYNLPINDNTDERLIDLMTLTLGFKSRHHYNVKQLTSLCSAFAEIVRNKGTLTSIELAGNALLTAEGIKDKIEVDYHLDSGNYNYSIIDIYIPQDLSDVNLFRDLLTYVLPAGVSCNLIRELKLSPDAYITEVATKDTVIIYDNSNTAWTSGNFNDVENNKTSIPEITNALNTKEPKATPGISTNVSVFKPQNS